MTTGWVEARQAARTAAEPLETITVPLRDALGLALAGHLPALVPLPLCDTAAMDGYAVRGPGPWTIVGRRLAGPCAAVTIEPGEAYEIATGAPIPVGAEAVLPIEQSSVDETTLNGNPGKPHIRRRGEDIPRGRRVLQAGAVVTPAALGLAASVGYDVLSVHRRPKVRVIVSGDELLTAGLPTHGQVRDAIGPLLPGLIADAGGELSDTQFVADRAGSLSEALACDDVDVIAVCGSTSVGPADHLRPVLGALKADVLVDGVACRPGHPQLLAALPDGRRVVGLPGNPFAALAAGHTLLAPLLHRLAGRSPKPPLTGRLRASIAARERETRLVPAVRTDDAIVPVGRDRAGNLWGAAMADVLAVVPPQWTGAEVEVLPL
ncbi:molybdopterin molybdotransferase MoeA [Kutzneria buriramensis]|uniref:Molybdopterin molybdenumtransferase n=1 Tax=Kutzneria buriramensis TaxID=1045776 RepID=A0A3E0I5M9_9PSEU|nr:molybdopterin molybdotransferase MoeA [Kutzneria buriramensis]REH53900.1 molybdopterin molybdotransferase [Kutzneria buriramensis]